MIAMAAAREGVSPCVYWHTRTEQEFTASIMGWIESWAMPVRMFTGKGGKGRAPADPTARRGAGRPSREPDILDFVAPRTGRDGRQAKRKVYDLRKILPLDQEWDPGQVQAMKASIGRGLLGNGNGR